MNKSNFIFLGMATSYILIAIIQSSIDGTLPASIYVTIAFVSLEFSALEILKGLINFLIYNIKQLNTNVKWQKDFIDRNIKVYNNFDVLNDEVTEMKNELTMLQNNYDISKNSRIIKYWEKILSVVTCVQIIICTIQIIVIPLKLIPYDKLTNKVINVVTLASFAFMFLSYFLSNIYNDSSRDMEESMNIYGTTSSAYLKILEKIASEEKNNHYEKL